MANRIQFYWQKSIVKREHAPIIHQHTHTHASIYKNKTVQLDNFRDE